MKTKSILWLLAILLSVGSVTELHAQPPPNLDAALLELYERAMAGDTTARYAFAEAMFERERKIFRYMEFNDRWLLYEFYPAELFEQYDFTRDIKVALMRHQAHIPTPPPAEKSSVALSLEAQRAYMYLESHNAHYTFNLTQEQALAEGISKKSYKRFVKAVAEANQRIGEVKWHNREALFFDPDRENAYHVRLGIKMGDPNQTKRIMAENSAVVNNNEKKR